MPAYARDYLESIHRLLWPEHWGGEWTEWDSAADYLEAIATIVATAESKGYIIPTHKIQPPIEETEWVRPEGYEGPDKKASSRCESGGRDFCTCDVCF
jgi:hypothetical protein